MGTLTRQARRGKPPYMTPEQSAQVIQQLTDAVTHDIQVRNQEPTLAGSPVVSRFIRHSHPDLPIEVQFKLEGVTLVAMSGGMELFSLHNPPLNYHSVAESILDLLYPTRQ